MPFEHEAERSFPKPYRGEPKNLRQDILDELADHLALATDRERERGGDDAAIWQRVLNRFGEPAAVARRLWWDAMKEQVMRDWIQTGVIVVMGLAMVVLVAFVVSSLGEMRQTNEAILAALQEGGGDDENMLTLTIAVHRGTPDGPPAEGVAVHCKGKFFGTDEVTLDESTDKAGRTSFGPILHGEYTLTLEDPLSGMGHTRSIVLFGGKAEQTVHVVAPDVEATEARLRSPLPDYIEDDFLLFKVNLVSQWGADENEWGLTRNLLVGKEGLYGQFVLNPTQLLPTGKRLSPHVVGTYDYTGKRDLQARPAGRHAFWKGALGSSWHFAKREPVDSLAVAGSVTFIKQVEPLFRTGEQSKYREFSVHDETLEHILRRDGEIPFDALGTNILIPVEPDVVANCIEAYRYQCGVNAISLVNHEALATLSGLDGIVHAGWSAHCAKGEQDGAGAIQTSLPLGSLDLEADQPAVLSLAPETADIPAETRLFLILHVRERRHQQPLGGLQVHALRSAWGDGDLPEGPVGFDEQPFLSLSAEEVRNSVGDGKVLLLDITNTLRADSVPTGFVLCTQGQMTLSCELPNGDSLGTPFFVALEPMPEG